MSYTPFHQNSIHSISRIDETIVSYFSPAYCPLCCRGAMPLSSLPKIHTASLISSRIHKIPSFFSSFSPKRWSIEKKTWHIEFHSTHEAMLKVEFYTRRIFWPSQDITNVASPVGDIDWQLFGCRVWRICDLCISPIARFTANYSQEMASLPICAHDRWQRSSQPWLIFKTQAANASKYRHRTERSLCYLQNLIVHIDRIGFLIYLSDGFRWWRFFE